MTILYIVGAVLLGVIAWIQIGRSLRRHLQEQIDRELWRQHVLDQLREDVRRQARQGGEAA